MDVETFSLLDEVKTLTKGRLHGILTLKLKHLNSILSSTSPNLSGGQGRQFCCLTGKIPCLHCPSLLKR